MSLNLELLNRPALCVSFRPDENLLDRRHEAAYIIRSRLRAGT